jgi:hypothetical protein
VMPLGIRDALHRGCASFEASLRSHIRMRNVGSSKTREQQDSGAARLGSSKTRELQDSGFLILRCGRSAASKDSQPACPAPGTAEQEKFNTTNEKSFAKPAFSAFRKPLLNLT